MKQWTRSQVIPVLPDGVQGLAFAANDQFVASCHYWSRRRENTFGCVRLVSPEGRIIRGHATAYQWYTGKVAVHPNGRHVACSGFHGASVNDLRKRKLPVIRTLEIERRKMNSLLYTLDGQWLICGGYGPYDFDRKVSEESLVIWNTTSWQPIPLERSGEEVRNLNLGLDGRTLLVGSDVDVQLWDTVLWNQICAWPVPTTESAQLSRDGKMLYVLTHSSNRVQTFQLPSFTPGPDYTSRSEINAMLLINHGRTLLTGGEDCMVTFWNTTTCSKTGQYPVEGGMRLLIDAQNDGIPYEPVQVAAASSFAVNHDESVLAVGDSAGRVHLIELVE